MRILQLAGTAVVLSVLASNGHAQTETNIAAYVGMSPVTALENTDAGKAALAANLAVTGAIQDGSANQPTLLPFLEEQQQALKDAAITSANASQLADGLGTRLGAAYQAHSATLSQDDGKNTTHTDISETVADVIAYAYRTANSDSAGAKFFFANLTLSNGNPVSANAAAVLTAINGKPDMFGRAYGLPAGSPGGDLYGNSRPFQTEPHTLTFRGTSLFGIPMHSSAYLHGPTQNLSESPSFPSGHTTYGYTEALLLALLVPERYPQMVVRAAEYGNNRVIIGAHYAMDVRAGRTLALYDLAHLLVSVRGQFEWHESVSVRKGLNRGNLL